MQVRFLAVLLFLLPGVALAQAPPAPTCRVSGPDAADVLLRATFDQPARTPAAAPRRPDEASPPRRLIATRDPSARLSGSSVHVVMTLERSDPAWTKVELSGVARTRHFRPDVPAALPDAPEQRLENYHRAGVFAQLRRQADRSAVIEVDLPRRAGSDYHEPWFLVVVLCDAESNTIFGYGVVEVFVHSLAWSAWVSGGLVATIYAMLVLVTLRVNGPRLARAAESRFGADPPPRSWRLLQAINPIFLAQDAAGIASLARLQLLVFTLAVVFVYTYVFARTGEQAALSEDVLKLLGITVLGSGLSRIVGESGSVTAANRIWLKGRRIVLVNEHRLPRLADLVCADGEVEVARVQAIVFSLLTVIALVWQGPRDLGGFEIAEETLYLLGISQLAYVAGKAIPAEGVRRLNQEISALRAAEREMEARQAALAAASDAEAPRRAEELSTARANWNATLTAAEDTLVDVYGVNLDRQRLHALRA